MTALNGADGGGVQRAGVVAFGVLASRISGFVRSVVVLAALGAGLLADAYQTANVLPNVVFDLVLGGVLSSVIVPLLVAARHERADAGLAYTQRLLTLTVVVLTGVAALGVLAAPLLIRLYAHGFSPQQHDLAVRWAQLCLPQIPLYGLGAFLGAVLNTSGRFAAAAWAPVANNVIVTVVAAGFLALVRTVPDPSSITTSQVWWIGAGTTAGVGAQALVLVVASRRCGIVLRPRFDWLHTGLARAARLSLWVMVYVLVNQAGLLVVTNLATAAGVQAKRQKVGHGAGYTVYAGAYQLFQVPYAVVAVSVITVTLPGLSAAVATGQLPRVRADLSRLLRTVALVLVPASAGAVALGPSLTVVLYGHGALDEPTARYTGLVLAAFAVGLVPFAAFQIQCRVLYALHDARSPAVVNAAATGVNITLDLVVAAVLPPGHQVVGLALALAISYLLAALGAARALRRHLTLLDGRRILTTHVQLLIAGLVGAVGAVLAGRLITTSRLQGPASDVITLVTATTIGAALFCLACQQLRVREFAALTHVIRTRLAMTRRL